MNVHWNPEILGDIFAVPAAVVDDHIKLAGSAQLKVLLWLSRNGHGEFNAEQCSKAIGLSSADCSDALQYWLATGMLVPAGQASPAVVKTAAVQEPTPVLKEEPKSVSFPAATETEQSADKAIRPRPVKPQMKEVLKRQKESSEFAYLLDTASSRLGRPISQGDMETLLYLYDTAGLPVEVILMVIGYAIAEDKYNMRYIEKVALDWADREITTIAAAEQYLCAIERRRQSWKKISTLLGLTISPTIAQSDDAERWICDWQTDEGLIRLAYDKCVQHAGKFNSSYMSKILEHWREDGVNTVDKAIAEQEIVKHKGKGKDKPKKETSFDLNEYENMVSNFTPVYTSHSK